MILVTGGTGFIGRALVSALVQQGNRVGVLTRHPGRLPVGDGSVEIRRGDLLDPPSLFPALDGVKAVFHLAAALPDAGFTPEAIPRTNVDGTTNLARAARQLGVEQFVLTSSAGVYGDGVTPGLRDESSPVAPGTLYEKTKLESERAMIAELSRTSVSWLILRPSGVHGPGRLASARFYRRICRAPLWIHGPTEVTVHPTYLGDVVTAALLTVGRVDLNAEVLNIAGAQVLTYQELIAFVASRLGVRVYQCRLPPRLTRAVTSVAARAANRFGIAPAALARAGVPINRTVDISKARRLLGFVPQPLEAGIDATIAWARQERLL